MHMKNVLRLLCLPVVISMSLSCMDWEDDYARKHWTHIIDTIEKTAELGKQIDLQQYQIFIDTMYACNKSSCFIDDNTKQLCRKCYAAYRTTDKKTKRFIRLQIKIQKEQEEYQKIYDTQ